MERSDIHRSRRRNWNKNNHKADGRRGGGERSTGKKQRLPPKVQQELYEVQAAIQEFKQKQIICARCGEPISDVISALADRETGNPVHFDCVLDYLRETEHIKENESITYIGQGRFAVVVFENPHDLRYFTIVRVIEWEPRDKQYEWRTQIAGLYSQIH